MISIKSKAIKIRKFLLVVFVVIFFALALFNRAQAANSDAIPCICKASVSSQERTATIYVASAADCDQNCANKYGSSAVYTLGLGGGAYQPVTKAAGGTANIASHTCSCSSTAPYSNAITGTFIVSNLEGCLTQCRGSNSKVYQYDTDSWKDVTLASSTPAPAPTPTLKQFDYPLLESFPGFFSAKQTLSDLPALILAIYKFGIWTIGIAGFFMLVVGGFMYMGSAGNTSTASSARGIIADALLGIVAALGAYLILYVINPELTKINISFTKVNVTETIETSPESAGTLQGGTSGSCGGLSTQTGISSQCTQASSGLAAMISCLAGKLPNAIITSISDSNGYSNCSPSNWQPYPSCAHAKYSCHYGGKTCFSTGKSYAVDLSTRNLSAGQIIAAAQACGASYVNDESGTASHVHVSVGQASGCGCN